MHSSRMHTARSSSRLMGGVCLSACWDTHTTPGSGPGDTPLPSPGVGLGTPQVWAWRPPTRPLNIPPGCGPGDHPPVNRMTDRQV